MFFKHKNIILLQKSEFFYITIYIHFFQKKINKEYTKFLNFLYFFLLINFISYKLIKLDFIRIIIIVYYDKTLDIDELRV